MAYMDEGFINARAKENIAWENSVERAEMAGLPAISESEHALLQRLSAIRHDIHKNPGDLFVAQGRNLDKLSPNGYRMSQEFKSLVYAAATLSEESPGYFNLGKASDLFKGMEDIRNLTWKNEFVFPKEQLTALKDVFVEIHEALNEELENQLSSVDYRNGTHYSPTGFQREQTVGSLEEGLKRTRSRIDRTIDQNESFQTGAGKPNNRYTPDRMPRWEPSKKSAPIERDDVLR